MAAPEPGGERAGPRRAAPLRALPRALPGCPGPWALGRRIGARGRRGGQRGAVIAGAHRGVSSRRDGGLGAPFPSGDLRLPGAGAQGPDAGEAAARA